MVCTATRRCDLSRIARVLAAQCPNQLGAVEHEEPVLPLGYIEPVAIGGHDGLVCVRARIAPLVQAVLRPRAPLRDDLRVARLRAAGQIHYLDGRIVQEVFVGERLHPEHASRVGRVG